jgi:hypothetical protein
VLVLATLAGCGRFGFYDPDDSTPDGAGGGDDSGGNPDSPPPPPPPALPAVYVHSPTDLYEITPETFELTHVAAFGGAFDGDTMTDIAVDRAGVVIGISFTQLYRVDPSTAGCALIAPLPRQFNGLTFMESPTDPNVDVLIGTTVQGEVWQIDVASGATTRLGRYGGGIASAGDVVSVRGFGTIAAVRQQSDTTDRVARVDLLTGNAVMIGDTGMTDIFGIAFWGGQLYGFTDGGTFVLIDPATGKATVQTNGTIRWWGAGVTTVASVAP